MKVVASPLKATAAATFEALPTNTFPLVSAVPTGEAVIVAVPPKATVFPLIVNELFSNLALVKLPSAILRVVTASFARFAVVTFASKILSVVTALFASFAVVTFASKFLAVVTFNVLIVVAPALSIVTSPLIAADAAKFVELPTEIFKKNS